MTGPPIYQADDTGQMRLAATAHEPNGLRVHELRPDTGLPLCGPKRDTWQGQPMNLVRLGRESVTCLRCAQITNS